MSRTLVITHKDCFDGHTAAWIISRFVERDAEFVAARYGDKPPHAFDLDVVIADFSYPRQEMFDLACRAKSLTVLDHHATAREALEGLEKQVLVETGKEITVVFDMERSGAGLVWDHFCAPRPRPYLVGQVEARDLWRIGEFNPAYMAAVYATEMTFEGWDELKAMPERDLIRQGDGILKYIREYGTKAFAHAHQVDFFVPTKDGHKIVGDVWRDTWVVNLPYQNCSDHLNRLMAEKNVNFVASYFQRGDKRWQFSLRSRNGFDCSLVAKAHGGGGHREAAGFDVERLANVF